MTDELTHELLQVVADQVGPSFYLADVGRLGGNLVRLREAFRAGWTDTLLGYSYKTNYLPAFILKAHGLGAWSEVVSELEYKVAELLGIPSDRIIVNGPVKTSAFLRRALGDGAHVNVDSLGEIDDACAVATETGAPVAIGIRCALGSETPGTRFGIDITDGDVRDQLTRFSADPRLRITGLHVHHSGDRSVDRFERRADALIDVHESLFADSPLEYLNLGGGFGSPMPPELADQMPFTTPTYEEYGEAVTAVLQRRYGPSGPTLVIEPGMAILADTMQFVTTVIRCKRDQARALAIVDGSIFCTVPLRGGVQLPVSVLRPPSRTRTEPQGWSIVGQTCMEIDVLREHVEAQIAPGDLIVFHNTGAYSTALTPTFIRSVPPVIRREALPQVVLLQAGTDELALTGGPGVVA